MASLHDHKTIRESVAAGKFYSTDPLKLDKELTALFSDIKNMPPVLENPEEILALIAPHAGYVFSGKIAASAFAQLKNITPRKKVFLIGSSHYCSFNGASIYISGDYKTPLGIVKVDKETVLKINNSSELFSYNEEAHLHEHTLEVLLPFLQYIWKDAFQIIPIIIATNEPRTCQELANVLLPYLSKDNLFVISTDLSHYPSYSDAQKIDLLTTKSVISGDPEQFLQQLETNREMKIPHLATSMCGWTSVLTLMYIARQSKNINFKAIMYRNSGDEKIYGSKNSVVGYQSIIASRKQVKEFIITKSDKKVLLETAELAINLYNQKKKHLGINLANKSLLLSKSFGAFVSVYIGNELHGCIGRLQGDDTSLIELIAELAVSAAFYDNRFTPVTEENINNLRIEISVLSPLKEIKSPDEIILGKHGIYIKKGFHSGTFLPQVADKTDWNIEEFLGNCSKNKAGIGWDGWKDADLFTYEAQVFSS